MKMSLITFWRGNDALAQLARFVAVGSLAAVIYILGTGFLREHTKLSVPVAASAVFALVVTINYVLHYFWTFRCTRTHGNALPRFLGVATGALVLNFAAVLLMSRLVPQSHIIPLLCGIGLVVVWNYAMSKFWVFIDHRQDV